MAHQHPHQHPNLPSHMSNLSMEHSRPSPPPGLQGVAPPPGFGAPPPGFQHQQQQPQGQGQTATPPPPGFGPPPPMMEQMGQQQMQQPGTPSNPQAHNGKAPNSGGSGGSGGQRRGPGGSQNLGMPPGQQGIGMGVQMQMQMPQQLPPQMFTTAAQLLDLTDKKLMVSLRDGRRLTGILRSWDQFANLVLQSTVERLFTSSPPFQYCEIPRGTFLVRGENVLLLGEIDLDKDDEEPRGWERGVTEEVQRRWLMERREGEGWERRKVRALRNAGFVGEEGEGVL